MSKKLMFYLENISKPLIMSEDSDEKLEKIISDVSEVISEPIKCLFKTTKGDVIITNGRKLIALHIINNDTNTSSKNEYKKYIPKEEKYEEDNEQNVYALEISKYSEEDECILSENEFIDSENENIQEIPNNPNFIEEIYNTDEDINDKEIIDLEKVLEGIE
jgi:hypothetical protein